MPFVNRFLRFSRVGALAVSILGLGCAQPAPSPVVPTNVPEWSEMTMTVTGRGAYPSNTTGPQARLMAERAARADAYRKLTEQVYGLEVRSGTTVRDAVLANDRIDTDVQGFIRGARVLGTEHRSDLGFVELRMELHLGRDFQRMLYR